MPGSFSYTPTNGTVLNMGTNALSVIFSPSDTVDYSSVTDSVSLVVLWNLIDTDIGAPGAPGSLGVTNGVIPCSLR